MTGLDAIAKERREQIEKHGYTEQHDAEHIGGELESAAAAVLTEDIELWPKRWGRERFLQITEKSTRDRLAVTGAFLAAEIDRIDRELAVISTNYPQPTA